VLTQYLPKLQEPEWSDPVVPPSLPEPFLEIVRQSLHSDSSRRWTVPQITAYLDPIEAVNKEIVTPPPGAVVQEAPEGSGYLIPVVGGVLLLAVLVMAPRLLKRGVNNSHHAIQSSEKVNSSPAPERHEERLAQPPPAAPLAVVPSAKQPAEAVEKSAESKATASIETPRSAGDEPAKAQTAPPVSPASQQAVIHQVLPKIPEKARSTIRGTVRVSVRVSVDSSGNVEDESLDVPGPSSYFAGLALQAAREWTFEPGSTDGGPDRWVIRFDFTSTDTKTTAVHQHP
jgi:TonB family protein